MFIRWQAEGETEPTVFEFDPDEVTSKEGQAIEKAMGGNAPSFEMWLELVRVGNIKARTILLWFLLQKEHPKTTLADVPDFKRKQLKVEMSVAELQELRTKMSKQKMEDGIREAFEAQFDVDIAEAMERETGVLTGELVPKHP
jgi:hypothetical protein